MTVHVDVGGGLAGLSAAIAVAGRGERVILSEAARHAGGRCRSYHDGLLDMTIDNGNHPRPVRATWRSIATCATSERKDA